MDNKLSGYVLVSDAAAVLDKSREWVYSLTDDQKIPYTERLVVGHSLNTPVRVIPVEDLYQYVRGQGTHDAAQLSAIRGELRRRANRLELLELTEQDREAIREQYLTGQVSLDTLSRRLRASTGSVTKLLASMGVQTKSRGQRNQEKREAALAGISDDLRQRIRHLYEQEGMGFMSISKLIGWGSGGHGRVKRVLTAMEVPLRSRADAAGLAWERRKEEGRPTNERHSVPV